jgi:hypothetical protein
MIQLNIVTHDLNLMCHNFKSIAYEFYLRAII